MIFIIAIPMVIIFYFGTAALMLFMWRHRPKRKDLETFEEHLGTDLCSKMYKKNLRSWIYIFILLIGTLIILLLELWAFLLSMFQAIESGKLL